MERYYALTVKIIKGPAEEVTHEAYGDVLKLLRAKQSFEVKQCCYELDSNWRLHLHAVVESNYINITKMNLKGCTVVCRPIFSMTGWVNYIHKAVSVAKGHQDNWQKRANSENLFSDSDVDPDLSGMIVNQPTCWESPSDDGDSLLDSE